MISEINFQNSNLENSLVFDHFSRHNSKAKRSVGGLRKRTSSCIRESSKKGNQPHLKIIVVADTRLIEMIEERIEKEMNEEIEEFVHKNNEELEKEIEEIRASYLNDIAPFAGEFNIIYLT